MGTKITIPGILLNTQDLPAQGMASPYKDVLDDEYAATE
jgi:hypothetical protein